MKKNIIILNLLLSTLLANPFEYNETTLQGYYFFFSASFDGESIGVEAFEDLNGNGLYDQNEPFVDEDNDGIWDNNNDWIGAFKCLEWENGVCNEVGECVGAQLWDRNLCGGGICEIAVMGDNGLAYSENYMIPGDVPAFRVYISTTEGIYDANSLIESSEYITPAEVAPWENFGTYFYEKIDFTDMMQEETGEGCTDESACNYDSDATEDDGSCEYAQENFDCDGNCVVDVDCDGVCGGSAIVDNCGLCIDSEENSCSFSAYIGAASAQVGDFVQIPITFNNQFNIPGNTFHGGPNRFDFKVEFDGSLLDPDSINVLWGGSNFLDHSHDFTTITINGISTIVVTSNGAGPSQNLESGTICLIDFYISDGNQEGDIITPLTFTEFFVNDIDFLESSQSGEIVIEQYLLGGCLDELACNYDSDATEDDGSCEYAQENFDCDGNCTAEYDCAGVCGGNAEHNFCGNCNILDTDCLGGCTNEFASNYDPNANYNDGSCEFNWDEICTGCTPSITSLNDVPDDQGSWARLNFLGSIGMFVSPSQQDTLYTDGTYTILREFEETRAWEIIGSFSSLGDSSYTYLAPTLGNATPTDTVLTTFKIGFTPLLGSINPTFYSDSFSGYSIDNIDPAVPGNFFIDLPLGSTYPMELAWSNPVDIDFGYFTITRNEEILGFSTESRFDDIGPLIGNSLIYSISSTDANGNQSQQSAEIMFEKADINYDQIVDILDIVRTVAIIMETIDPSIFEIWAANLNNDDVVDILDVVMLVNIIMNN